MIAFYYNLHKKAILVFCFYLFTFHFCQAQDSIKTASTKVVYGKASWYSDKFNGRKTATGEVFSQQKFTAASNQFALGTWLKITNLRNNKFVYVKINDRMHPKMKRIVDLTRAAAQKLSMIKSGVVKVKVEVYGKTKPVEED